MSVAERILSEARALPEGRAIPTKAFQRLGSRSAVHLALSGLVQSKGMIRVTRGYYVLPVQGRFGPRAPSFEAVVTSIAAQENAVVAKHGLPAANCLGLTTQLPMRVIYVTSGPDRMLMIGSHRVELRHVPLWQLTNAGKPSGDLIRALEWIGEADAVRAMRKAVRLDLDIVRDAAQASDRLPTWMRAALTEILNSRSEGSDQAVAFA